MNSPLGGTSHHLNFVRAPKFSTRFGARSTPWSLLGQLTCHFTISLEEVDAQLARCILVKYLSHFLPPPSQFPNVYTLSLQASSQNFSGGVGVALLALAAT